MVDWRTYLYGFAVQAATGSKDSTKVGAILLKRGRIVSLTAFNGPPAGVIDKPERLERPLKYLFAAHAEENLISFAAREGIRTEGATVMVTHHPCAACARKLIQAGIVKVIYGPNSYASQTDDVMKASTEMFAEAGVICEPL